MRIDWLRIPKYRNLRNFEINFDESQTTTVLLGHNSSGKSNLLEAIVEIFTNLDSNQPAPFAYTMRYLCRGQAIEVQADPQSARRPSVSVDGKLLSSGEYQKNKEMLLPAYVFGYYSGWASRLEKQFDEKTRRYRQDILNKPSMPPRRFFFCRREYSQLVLLAFFLAEETTQKDQARKILNDYLNIVDFDTALFVMNRPQKADKSRPKPNEDTDPRFWNMDGAFRSFLNLLWQSALAPVRSAEVVERDFRRRGEPTERLYLFIKNREQLNALRQPYETTKLFFSNLESLYLCDLMDEVRVRVIKKDGSKVLFSQLSEGEQQLLTVLGLLLFTQDDESLYLLDEPNTHLNPVWTYEYLERLKDNMKAENGQIIVTTHDPMMIGSLSKNQVRVMTQEENITRAPEPLDDPFSIGIEGLLKSELYGLRSSYAPIILEKLDRYYLLSSTAELTLEEEEELNQLDQKLAQYGISRTHPNPYFEHFANALAQRAPHKDTNLTEAEINEQKELAQSILDEILAEEQLKRMNEIRNSGIELPEEREE